MHRADRGRPQAPPAGKGKGACSAKPSACASAHLAGKRAFEVDLLTFLGLTALTNGVHAAMYASAPVQSPARSEHPHRVATQAWQSALRESRDSKGARFATTEALSNIEA